MRRVRGLPQESGMLVLIALNDLNLVLKFADKVAILSDGTLHDFGPAPRVLTPDNSPPPSASRRASNPARRAHFIWSSTTRFDSQRIARGCNTHPAAVGNLV